MQYSIDPWLFLINWPSTLHTRLQPFNGFGYKTFYFRLVENNSQLTSHNQSMMANEAQCINPQDSVTIMFNV